MEIFECGELSRCLLMIFEIGDKVHLQVYIMVYFRDFQVLIVPFTCTGVVYMSFICRNIFLEKRPFKVRNMLYL